MHIKYTLWILLVSYSSVLKEGMMQIAGGSKINGANWVGGGEI